MTTTTKSSPPSLTVLGFDFGLKKMGIAVGQTITQTASPIEIIRVQNGELPKAQLSRLLSTWKPNAIVIGIPLNMDGTVSAISEYAETFAKFLETESQLPVHRVDERLTTKNARYELDMIRERTNSKQKEQLLDAMAACLIVESWLKR